MNLRPVKVDLHLHTVLSPCGELEMGAPEVVAKALHEGIEILAITDHNSCLNYPALKGAARDSALTVIPGMEVQTVEDVHVVTLFPDYERALACQDWVWEALPDVPNREDLFGYQVVIDEKNGVLDMVPRLLVQGTDRTVDQVIHKVHQLGGLTILAHVDRPAFSYLAVLGFIPDDLTVDAVEVSARATEEQAKAIMDSYPSRTFLKSSDSHRLSEIDGDRCSTMILGDVSFDEIKKALLRQDGRSVEAKWRRSDA
nr:PHP domain-containing protein [uncultured Dethiosulfovibrio sp.]